MASHSMAPSDSEVAETLEDIKKHLAAGLSLCCCISAMGRCIHFYVCTYYVGTLHFSFLVCVGRVGGWREREVLSLDIFFAFFKSFFGSSEII